MTRNLRSIAIIILLAFASLPVFSQWTQRQNLGGMPRSFATGFTVNNTIYLMCGYDGSLLYNDVWAYDPATDSWTRKGDFPGGFRSAATAFTIGSKAYFGTGNDGNVYLNDFWEYEPVTDTWTQKANFPGYEREEAVGFGIGNKGYLGTGQTFVVGPNSSWTTTYNDFYEYDPINDNWTQKDSFPGAPRAYASGAVIGNKGYLGLGGNDDQSASYTDFYEYDPLTDNWTTIASMGGSGRADAGIVASENTMYVIGGINFPSFAGVASCKMYDATTNTWSNAPTFNGGVIIAPVVQNVNGRVFAGSGYYSNLTPRNDWWEFTSLPTSIETVSDEQSIAFPNPFSKELEIHLKNNSGGKSIEIFDVQSRRVYWLTKIVFDEAIKINTTNLSPGIYLLLIKNSSGEIVSSKKIIKN